MTTNTASGSTSRPRAIVTGGGSGIGLALVERLLFDHHVHALVRDPAKHAALLGREHLEVEHLDVRDHAGLANLIAKLPRLDVLVHCAAISTPLRVEQARPEQWREHFEVNVIGPAELTRQALPLLRPCRGTVVFVGSGAGYHGLPGRVVYSASKFALRALADALRKEEALNGIRVATVAPGSTETPLNRSNRDAEPEPGYISNAETVAAAIRTVIDAGGDSQITDLIVRPRFGNFL